MPGEIVGGYQLLRLLGRGAFGIVYLAREESLGREVALKITANRGEEARTMASLEHDHIVRVFSETLESDGLLRLLCMQYIPGPTLAALVEHLHRNGRRPSSGEEIVDAIDRLCEGSVLLDPSALRDRELLCAMDFHEAVAWMGARLADALEHAHVRGVLHRDIKPANVLLGPYGRPHLADFSLSFRTHDLADADGAAFGGTLAYMAPEHIEAFDASSPVGPEVVDERSDLYGLGLVLFETLTGKRPFKRPEPGLNREQALALLAAQRRGAPPSPRTARSDIPEPLDRVIRQCLRAEPEKRLQRSADLAAALEGCRALGRSLKRLPAGGALTRSILRQPFLWLVLLGLFPHLLGSGVNIAYNGLRIVGDLEETQRAAFTRVVLAYNALAYPVCVAAALWLLWPLVAAWRTLGRARRVDPRRVSAVRRRVLALPRWMAALACLGWFPGIIIFPLGIEWLAGPVSARTHGHFFVSFAISGLIALTYSYIGLEYVILRGLYPRLWPDAREVRSYAVSELSGVIAEQRFFQLLAGLIPLVAAALVVGVGPREIHDSMSPRSAESEYFYFRILVTALIALGGIGFQVTTVVTARLAQVVEAFTSEKQANTPGSWTSRHL